jgi:ssRNA-specific RNase YbeY (16S rRNA maturation enzyme)
MLHLLGYDHERSEEEDKEMRAKQSEIMKIMGLEVK